jgi:hypothetical protein
LNARPTRIVATAAVALLATLALAASASAAPANDNIAGAQPLSTALPLTTGATTIGATGEMGETVFGNAATESVWFVWTPSASTTAIVDLCSAGFSGGSASFGIGVYTGGTTFASLTKVADVAGECKLKFSAVAGTAYKIQIDFLHAQGTFNLTLRAPNPPANDNFASAQGLGNGLPVSVGGSTIDSTFEAGEPAGLGGSGSSRSVWYSWTSPVTGQVQLSGCPFETQPGSAANKTLGVYTGTTLAGLTKVVETNNCTVEFKALAATTYKIAFSGSIRGEGTFTLALRQATPPSNDNLASAATIGPALPLAVQGDNSFATIETGESSLPISGLTGATHSVWFQWTPSVTERVKLNACNSEHQPRLGIFTGTTIATLTPATEPQSQSPYCAAELSAVAGTSYKVVIAGGPFDGSTGPFELEIHAVSRPGNDNFAAATPIGPELPIAVDGTNADATTETGEVSPAQERQPIATVWYRWDSGFSGPVDISTCGSSRSDFAAVHTGTPFAAMTQVVPMGENEPGSCGTLGQKGARDRFTAIAGTTYWIQLSSPAIGFEGAFHLTITDPNARPVVVVPPPPATVITSPRKALTMKQAVAQCRKQFHGSGKKVHAKRAKCIAKVKRKFAIAKCLKIGSRVRQQKCIASARRRFS